jgi:hypothetical protein
MACVRAAAALEDMRRSLYESLGCFQGTGSQVHAIDTCRLRSAWRAKEQQDDPQQIRTDMKAARDAAAELSGARLNALIARYRTTIEGLLARTVEIIGTESDDALLPALQTLITNAHKLGLISGDGFSFQRAQRELELLGEDRAKVDLRRAISFVVPAEDATVHKRLAAWAEWDVHALRKMVDALNYLESLAQAIEREGKAALKASGSGDVAAAVNKLQSDLNELAKEKPA